MRTRLAVRERSKDTNLGRPPHFTQRSSQPKWRLTDLNVRAKRKTMPATEYDKCAFLAHNRLKTCSDSSKEMAGPVGFEPTAPGLPRSLAGLEGRCFGHPDFGSTGAVQAELRARYAHTGLLPISAFFSAPSEHENRSGIRRDSTQRRSRAGRVELLERDLSGRISSRPFRHER
jgi:hypothetical protein